MISVKRIRFYTAVKCVYTSVNAGDVANHIANEHDCEASYSVKKVMQQHCGRYFCLYT